MYSKFPRQMLRAATTISEGVQTVWPLRPRSGDLYVPEEAADMAPPPHRKPPHILAPPLTPPRSRQRPRVPRAKPPWPIGWTLAPLISGPPRPAMRSDAILARDDVHKGHGWGAQERRAGTAERR